MFLVSDWKYIWKSGWKWLKGDLGKWMGVGFIERPGDLGYPVGLPIRILLGNQQIWH